MFCVASSFFNYLYVSFSGLFTSVGKGREVFAAIFYSQSCGFCSGELPLLFCS